jgi:hypothetical protein
LSDLEQFLGAIAKLPPAGGLTWRGLDSPADTVPPVGVLTGVVSTSRDARVATENFTARTILVLLNRSGRDLSMLSANPAEAEVVQRPGSVWHRLPDLEIAGAPAPVVALEEFDVEGRAQPSDWPTTLPELTTRVSQLLSTAQQSDQVPITRPDVFVGPWPARPWPEPTPDA